MIPRRPRTTEPASWRSTFDVVRILCTAAVLLQIVLLRPGRIEAADRPNIVLVMADDLGYAEVGCYGQTKIRTPNVDKLAAQGMRFTQFYSGNPVCAPSRCTLLTGYHTGHAEIRSNKELGGWNRNDPEGQWPLTKEAVTIAELLKTRGYATACVGKWGLGGPDSEGLPNRQGFDFYFGHICQKRAHNFYPEHLWKNEEKYPLPGNPYFSAHQRLKEPPADESGYDRFSGEQYAGDEMIREALGFIREHADEPFFLYYPTPVPHVSLQVPEDSLAEYSGKWEETPYLGQKAYLPHPKPRAAYAAMVTRMDGNVGKMMDLLDELGVADDTLFVFTSDNGPTFNGGSDSAFFESTGGLRGLKVDVYEGGIRVPCVVRWPGHVKPDTTTDFASANWDLFSTLADVAGVDPEHVPNDVDGLSLVPTLEGREQEPHDVLYWELNRQQALRAGDWKLVRITDRMGRVKTELFNLAEDRNETTNLAKSHPQKLAEMVELAERSRTPSKVFPSPYDPRRPKD